MKTNILRKLFSWCPQPKTSGSANLTRLLTRPKHSRLFYAVPAATAILVVVLLAFWYFTSLTGPGPVIIEITSDKRLYSQGENVVFNVYVKNEHSWRVPKPNQVNYRIGEDGVSLNINLLPGQTFPAFSRTFYDDYVWDQKTGPGGNRTQLPPGNYTLRVSFGGPTNYGNEATCTVEIRSAP